MRSGGLGDFAAHILTLQADITEAQEAAVVKSCRIIQKTAKGMLGHEQPFWPGLRPETIARKARGNTPLLETGELRGSIEITAPVHEGIGIVSGYVGSASKIALWQELGTDRIPPRPFIGLATIGREKEILEM